MITLFCIMIGIALIISMFVLGFWLFGIALMILGGINIWKSKWLEPTDYKDNEHMERTRKRLMNKAIFQIVIGFIIFIVFLV